MCLCFNFGAWVCEIRYRYVPVGLCEEAHTSAKSPIVREEDILTYISPKEVLYKERPRIQLSGYTRQVSTSDIQVLFI